MESRKRIQLNLSDAKSDLFTAYLACNYIPTLFHYEQILDGRGGLARRRHTAKTLKRVGMKKGPLGPFSASAAGF